MPANLPPEYYEAEKAYKEAAGKKAKIAALERLISTIPKHKGTDKLRADFRRRLSRLHEADERGRKGSRGDLYHVSKEGAAQAVMVGIANSGKSALVKTLTNAEPLVADYPMSTVMPLVGMMPFEDIFVQLVDLPPVGYEATDGWVSGIIRNSDVLLLVVDLADEPMAQAELLFEQLGKWGIAGKKTIVLGNKSDAPGADRSFGELEARFRASHPVFSASAKTKAGLDALRAAVFRAADIIRVYTREPGKEPDLKHPFTLPRNTTILELGEKIHKDFASRLRFARLWGSSKIPGQKVQRDYVLEDKDIVELHV